MVATAHSDPYGIFMRRIGYTGGLEHTLERLRDLEDRYLVHGDLTVGTWNALVHGEGGWKLRSDNIDDSFFALRLIHRTPGDVLVLENLDAAAIAASLLHDDAERHDARSLVLLWAVLVNDGELFVNFLLAGFEEQAMVDRLAAMIRHKLSVLSKAIGTRDAVGRLARVVAIERQVRNRGSAGAGRSVKSLVRREPLGALVRTAPLQDGASRDLERTLEKAVQISGDYFRKVPPRRKDWARTLGLWSDEEGLTARGRRFVDVLQSADYIRDDDFFTFWPMDYELVRSGFKPDLLGEAKSLWTALMEFAGAYTNVRVKPFEPRDSDALVEQLRSMMAVYRSLHTRKSMLRRELAITVAYPASVAIAAAQQRFVVDWPKALLAEQTGGRRRIALRRSRRTGGALAMAH